jgi:o-succinylbenzoate---CoA ligase
VIAEGRTVTYGELHAELPPVGEGPLLVEARATVDFVRRMHAAWRAEIPFVPIDPRLSEGEREARLRSVGSLPEGTRTVIFTSGTTGAPKPVALTAANHDASAIASAWNLGVAPGDRWLCCLPPFHVGGLSILHRSAIYGTTAILHDGFDADRVRTSIESGEATIVSLVSTMLHRLVGRGLDRWPELRAALVGGGRIPRELVDWARERDFPLLLTYGLTETASQVATGPPGAVRPLPGVELRAAEGGELLVRGPMVAVDGWLRTGDRGRLDEAGNLHVEGRLADTIVTGGENVSAAEVEEALAAHPAVAEAAVVGRPDPEWGEAVTAFVVLRAEVADAELIAHCRERIAGYKVPKAVHRVGELPRNAAGKVVRGQLLESAP